MFEWIEYMFDPFYFIYRKWNDDGKLKELTQEAIK